MTPLPDSLLESVAAAAVREGLADAIFTRLNTPHRQAARRQGARRPRPHRASRRRPRTTRSPRWPPRSARASSAPTASWRPSATRSRSTSRATRTTLDLPVDLRLMAAPFRHAVLEELHRDVPRGETVTYGELAARAGNPKAVARRRHGVRAQPDPDRRALPPRAARARAASATTAAARSASACCSSSRASA